MDVHVLGPEDWPWPLLLDADPSREMVETYIHQATVLGLVDNDRVVAVVVLLSRDAATVEVMNLAVTRDRRRQGLGQAILTIAIDYASQQGAERLVLGTGNSSLSQLAFYQKMGFRIDSVDRDYFVRTYPEPIFENGIQCRDRLWLAFDL